MYASEYPLSYTGPDGGLMYDDWCRIVREVPHGTVIDGQTFVGAWVEVQVYPEDDRFIVPRRALRDRK